MVKVLTRIAVYVLLSVLAAVTLGCAVHHYDAQTGIEHVWGFGHMKMKVAPAQESWKSNAPPSIVTGVKTFGFTVGTGKENTGVSCGWNSSSRITIPVENTHFYLLWPSNAAPLPLDLRDLFSVRIGRDFPDIRHQEPSPSP